jgi:antirestriction protein ArdC
MHEWLEASLAKLSKKSETAAAADLKLRQGPREDHAAYIASWLEVLKNDNRAIFTAAAQRAADYLNQIAAAQVEARAAA